MFCAFCTHQVQDGYSYTKASIVFLGIMMIGSFFLMNMVLATIENCYNKSHENMHIQGTQKLARKLYFLLEGNKSIIMLRVASDGSTCFDDAVARCANG